jgi:hypothetical protein
MQQKRLAAATSPGCNVAAIAPWPENSGSRLGERRNHTPKLSRHRSRFPRKIAPQCKENLDTNSIVF